MKKKLRARVEGHDHLVAPPYLSETAKIVGLHGTCEKFRLGLRRVLPAADGGRRLESVVCSTSHPRAARWTPACQAMRHRSRLGCRPPVGAGGKGGGESSPPADRWRI
eukprot:scaffold8745_cov113-Isochrysis_galbana.AAC.2